jgi:hypothetical protein
MNGWQVAEAARQMLPGLKVLFITGYAENAALRGVPGAGPLSEPARVAQPWRPEPLLMPVSRPPGFAPGPAADRPIDVPRVLSLHYGRQNTACADEKAERGMAATVVGGRAIVIGAGIGGLCGPGTHRRGSAGQPIVYEAFQQADHKAIAPITVVRHS